jgi:hypothetical protein
LDSLCLLVTAFLSIRGAQEYLRDVRTMDRDFYGVVRTRDRADPVAVSLNASRRHRSRRPAAGRRVSQSTERLLWAFFGLWALVRRR